MAVTLVVPPGVLERAGREWGDAHDKLSGARTRLDEVATSGLSAAVSSAVSAFLDVWSKETSLLSRQAASNADAFTDLDTDLDITDVAEARRLRSLLPYVHHAAAIEAA